MTQEQKIEQAAENYKKQTANKMQIEKFAFVAGAKSEASKEYWLNDFEMSLETFILNNEDDFDRGKWKVLLEQFIQNLKNDN